MKRTLSLVLTLVMVIGIFTSVPVTVSAASVSDLTFTLNDDSDSYSVTGCNKDAYGVAIIPSTYKGLPVTSIGDYAFRGCTSLTSITIPDSVTSIGEQAFYECTSLTSITIPDGVTSIGERAFCYCSSLTSITIPASVTSIGSIYGCTSLTSINVNEDNDYYSSVNGVFFNKDKTVLRLYPSGRTNTSYTVPNGVTSIGDYAFWDSTSLTSITIPDSVTSIGYYAFRGCTSLTSITIPDDVTSIDFRVFYHCDSLTSITIPDGVTSIGDEAFYYCTNLTSITIPDSVTSIGDEAFESCTSLASITIPDSVTSIGGSAFYDTAYYNNSTNWDNEVLYIGNHLIRAKRSLSGSYAIKNGTRTIAGNAFYYCDSLTSVAIPDSVTSIGEYAFLGCTSLTSVTIPDSVTSIGYYAFSGCTSLTSVTIPDSVTSIGDWAFEGCYNLSEVVTPCNSYACTYFKAAIFAILKLTHTLSSDWVVTKEATCTESGAKTKTCSVCGDVVTEAIDALGHDYSTEWTVDEIPTCTEKGSKSHHCARCDAKTDVTVIEAAGHNPSSWIVDAFATCTQSGMKYKKCTVCEGVIQVSLIPATGHKEGDWVIDKKATVEHSGSKHKECTECGEILEKTTIKQLKCAEPTIKTIANKDYGVRFEWKKVEGANSYKVCRKVSGGSYKLLGTTTKTAFADKTAKSGTKYYYVVKATNEAGDSEKSASKGITFLAMPTIKTIANASTGVKLTWGKVSGADSYKVYRKTSSGSYAYIGKTTSTSYTDKTAKSGTKYYYVVKAVKDSYVSAKSEAKSITFLSAPKISGASSGKSGVNVKWGKIKGAEGYIVYRKASDGDWKKLAKVKGNTKVKYLDETPRKGVTYQYKVKAYNGSSTSVSSGAYKIKCKY